MGILGIIARWIMYALLGVVCACFAGVVYAAFGAIGATVGTLSFAVLCVFMPRAAELERVFPIAGALLGGGCGLLLLAKLWISQAQQSDDPTIRRLGDSLAELSRAVRRPR